MSYPYVAQKSKNRYYVPKTLADDFKEFLKNDIPGAVMDFVQLRDWNEQFNDGYVEKTVRCQIYPDSSKSRYSNTDNNQNVRASMDSDIIKGDMLIDPNGSIYLLDWFPPDELNCKSSRALRCNMYLNITRYTPQVTDEMGYLIEPEGNTIIVDKLPCNAYRYDGRPEYASTSGQPGVTPNALTLLSVQYNKQTANIKQNDEFIWADDTYIVVDINYVGVQINGSNGVITLQAKKKPGGIL